ncbi:MAG: DUF4349 domain-containing protein [Sphingomonas sp.]|nr:MAG: DUF4349 domain-containing protein [Sphingomonas sp.]
MRGNAVLLAVALLAACGQAPQNRHQEKLNAFDVEPATGAQASPSAVSAPRIAYSYTVTYAFDRHTVGQVQGQQLAFCRRLGSTRCLIVKSTLNVPGREDHIVNDEAVLLVDAQLAGEFNRRLDALAVTGGATTANRQVEAEDVTRQVIDTDARVRAKEALAERLLGIIRSGKGKVGELVEAERAYAATQEELDSARGKQADLAQRVAMSRVTIRYAFDDTPGRQSPIHASFATAGDTLATSLATLVTAAVAGLPWLVVGGLVLAFVRWIRRKRGWRWPRRALASADAKG